MLVRQCLFSSCAKFERVAFCSNFSITGDGLVSPLEHGSPQPRHHSLGTFPAIHETAAVWALPVAADARTHLPRRQA